MTPKKTNADPATLKALNELLALAQQVAESVPARSHATHRELTEALATGRFCAARLQAELEATKARAGRA